ncbi:MAG: gluconolaconase [Kangiella sp.]|nr:MAG: gluconolaconase [Kangiella sp.]
MKLIDSIKVNNQLGESVIWDAQEQCVWWIDIFGKNIYRLQWPSKNLDVFSTTERPCAIGLTDKDNILIVAFETGVSLYNPKTKEIIEWIYRPFKLNSGIRFNDGKIDRQGRFWISTMIESTEKINITQSGLYCIESNGKITKHLSDFTIGNSLAFSPCSTKLYFSDSNQQTIWQFDFNSDQAKIFNQSIFSKLEGDACPDGADVDNEGNLWCTNWGDSSLSKYSIFDNEKIDESLPVSQPTCLAFGGKNLDYLFVTSANYQLSKDELAEQPNSGSLLIYQTSSKGIAPTRFGEVNG